MTMEGVIQRLGVKGADGKGEEWDDDDETLSTGGPACKQAEEKKKKEEEEKGAEEGQQEDLSRASSCMFTVTPRRGSSSLSQKD